jgi:hypothetical protein
VKTAASLVLDPEGEKGGGYGVFTEGFKGQGSYWRGSNRRPLPLTEREGEIRGEDGADRWGPPVSGEREETLGKLGWFPSRAGSAGLGPGCGPVGLCPSSFFSFFFVLIPFSYFLISCFRL